MTVSDEIPEEYRENVPEDCDAAIELSVDILHKDGTVFISGVLVKSWKDCFKHSGRIRIRRYPRGEK